MPPTRRAKELTGLHACRFPTLYAKVQDRYAAVSSFALIYYMMVGNSAFHAFPQGLRMVFGNATVMSTPARTAVDVQGQVNWHCQRSVNGTDLLENSATGQINMQDAQGRVCNLLQARMIYKSCWDGINLDSPDHRSHMAYASGPTFAQVCPASHPVAVPQLQLEALFPLGPLSTSLAPPQTHQRLPQYGSVHNSGRYWGGIGTGKQLHIMCFNQRLYLSGTGTVCSHATGPHAGEQRLHSIHRRSHGRRHALRLSQRLGRAVPEAAASILQLPFPQRRRLSAENAHPDPCCRARYSYVGGPADVPFRCAWHGYDVGHRAVHGSDMIPI